MFPPVDSLDTRCICSVEAAALQVFTDLAAWEAAVAGTTVVAEEPDGPPPRY